MEKLVALDVIDCIPVNGDELLLCIYLIGRITTGTNGNVGIGIIWKERNMEGFLHGRVLMWKDFNVEEF